MDEVLVVGAGPTGLTLAVELARRGVGVRVVEASDRPQAGSRGKGVQPRTLEVFEDLGVADTVLAHGRLAMPMRVTGPDGRSALRGVDVPEPRPDVPYQASLITPEWRVEQALRDRLAELGVGVEFGTELIGLEQSEQAVTATLVRDGVSETVTVPWLIGCDGGRSVVRKGSAITFDGETREDVRMIVADVRVVGLDRDAWHMWMHEEGMVNLCPLPSTDLFQFQASISPGQDAELVLTNLQTILDRRTGRDDLLLEEPEWRTLWRANVRLVDRYRDGRVLLAGDAAHVHSPAGGQGMNTGIQDAYNLGWKLALVVTGASPELLDTYDAERRPIAAGVLALSDERLRQAIEQKGIPTRRDATTMQIALGYRDSALARDDRGDSGGSEGSDGSDGVLRAGDRAPDATQLVTTDGERRLFDLLSGPDFTLLAFGEAPVPDEPGLRVLRVVDEPRAAGDIADRAGQLVQAYGAGSRTLVLIRPDGYVGLISDAGDRAVVTDHLAMIRRGAGSAG